MPLSTPWRSDHDNRHDFHDDDDDDGDDSDVDDDDDSDAADHWFQRQGSKWNWLLHKMKERVEVFVAPLAHDNLDDDGDDDDSDDDVGDDDVGD